MALKKKSTKVVFIDKNIKKAWEEVRKEDKELAKHLERAVEDIKKNAFCGRQAQKKLIPKKYIKRYGINNLWIYDLPSAWRLLYSITTPNKIEIISVVLDWMDHKDYEKLFKF